ncbi:MAG: 5-oxoprolinase subunit PxpB [Cyclobacteriaceae bacterium]
MIDAIRPFNENTILIEWKGEIGEAVLHEILSFQDWVESLEIKGVLETWIAYRSLAIHYQPERINTKELIEIVQEYNAGSQVLRSFKKWILPVCYESKCAPDLSYLSQELGHTEDKIISLHTSKKYLVHFIGFLPGFMYLSGLDERIHFPRKENPKQVIPKGAVGIGGFQTGIYPTQSPGGWNIIGNCPLTFFDLRSDKPCFIQPGDTVEFNSISSIKYESIKVEMEAGVYDLNNLLADG